MLPSRRSLLQNDSVVVCSVVVFTILIWILCPDAIGSCLYLSKLANGDVEQLIEESDSTRAQNAKINNQIVRVYSSIFVVSTFAVLLCGLVLKDI